jgi:diaminopimelate decarboxylase
MPRKSVRRFLRYQHAKTKPDARQTIPGIATRFSSGKKTNRCEVLSENGRAAVGRCLQVISKNGL